MYLEEDGWREGTIDMMDENASLKEEQRHSRASSRGEIAKFNAVLEEEVKTSGFFVSKTKVKVCLC